MIMGDFALFTVFKIIAKVNASSLTQKYNLDSRLIEKGFRVSMGFGMHYGWAIEGPIGSQFKVDFSYLSPNVNICSRLESVSK